MKKVIIPIVIVAAAVILIFAFRGGGEEEPVELANVTPDVLETIKNKTTQPVPDEVLNLEAMARVGFPAPDFSAATYNGQEIRLSDFRGKSGVLLNFWAGWCPFCVEEMPLMADVQEKFQGQYVTIAVNRAESLKTAKKFSDQVEVSQRLLLLLDEDDSVYRLYNGFAMPYSIFIDKNGVIQDIKLGPFQREELEERVQKII